MNKAWFWLVLVLSATAIAASSILLVDYVRPQPVFCELDGGCAALRQTVFARPFGVPLPIFGVSGILLVALAACLRGRRPQIGQAVVASIGALAALFFFWVQYRFGTLCPYCAVVDGSMLVLAILSVARAVRRWEPPESRRMVLGAASVHFVAIAAPLTIGAFKKPPALEVPSPIAAEIAKTPPGKVTVVDFIDFECPFCRATQKELSPLLAEYKDKVRVVRKHVPLRMHPHAMDAARAGCCAETLGKGDEAADMLVEVDPSELTPEGCAKIAEKLGLDRGRFEACMADPRTVERIRSDGEMFRAANGRGLPMIYVGEQRLVGAQDRESIRAALDAAAASL